MKTSLFAALAFAVLTLGSAIAQDEAKTAAAREGSQAATVTAKPLIVSGKISADGKTLMTDIDSEWTISNAETSKGHEGHRVTIKCYVDTEKSELHVLSIRSEEGELKSANRLNDSAFRR